MAAPTLRSGHERFTSSCLLRPCAVGSERKPKETTIPTDNWQARNAVLRALKAHGEMRWCEIAAMAKHWGVTVRAYLSKHGYIRWVRRGVYVLTESAGNWACG